MEKLFLKNYIRDYKGLIIDLILLGQADKQYFFPEKCLFFTQTIFLTKKMVCQKVRLPNITRFRFFPNSRNCAMGSLAEVRSGAASTPGSGQGSGGFWCRYLVRFRIQIPCEVPEVSGAGTR